MSDDDRTADPEDADPTASGESTPDASDASDESPDDEDASSAGSSGRRTAPWMVSGDGEETTLADVAAEEDKPEGTPSIGYLPTLPDAFVTLGAGCLATASLLSFAAFAFVLWMRATGNVRDLMPWELTLAAILMGFATVLLAAGSYFALKRVRWTVSMLAALVGSFAVLTLPFTAVAVVCIGLGRAHFSAPFVGDAATSGDDSTAEE